MGLRLKKFDMKVRKDGTQQFIDVGLLGSDVDGDISALNTKIDQEISNRQNAISAEVSDRNAAIGAEVSDRNAAIGVETNARISADATLQNSIISEASTRSAADSNLQSQINQIVAPSGEAPSAAEVQNARIGENGKTYTTLGESVRTQVKELHSGFEGLLFNTKGFSTAVTNWHTSESVISPSSYWGMSKVYHRGFIKNIIQKIVDEGSPASVILYSTDGNMRTLKIYRHSGNAPIGYLVYDINEYISEDFYIFVNGKTAFRFDENATYRSRAYDAAEFTNTAQFVIGAVYGDVSPLITSDPAMRFIKSITILDANYAEYALTCVWKNSFGYKYLFRLEASNNGGANWTHIRDIGATSGDDHVGYELLTCDKFVIAVNWDETDATVQSNTAKPIKNYSNAGYLYNKLSENTTPFEQFVSGREWIEDIQVTDTTYKQYKISYLWKESKGYHYYIRLEGSNDGSTWTMVDNIGLIITEGEAWTNPSAEILKSEIGKFTVVVNWDLSPATYTTYDAGVIKPTHCIGVEQYYVENGMPTASYAIKDETKHYVVVDTNGTGDFTTVADACDYVRNQNPTVGNQFEIVVKPGRYSALAVIIPPFTHMHGQFINSVVITSEDYAGESTQPPLRQDFGSSKLSNLHIISGTGYCIHYDQGLNNAVIYNENLILEKVENGSIIGGGSFKNATFVWKNCTFVNGDVPCHTNRPADGWDNTKVVFDSCKLVNAYFRNGSVGGQGGEYIFEINDSYTKLGETSLVAWQDDWANTTDPTLYAANTCEWQVVGKTNKNFLPQIGNTGTGLMVETANVNEQLSIGGTAVPVLFGYAKVRKGGPRLKGRAYGIYRVQDKKAGNVRGQEGIDVFQMWKRLGNCSTNPLTLTVTVGNVTQTYTFNQNYESAQTSETTILAAINAVFTIAKVYAYTPDCWENIQTEEKSYVIASGTNGILAGEYVRHDGTVCQLNDSSNDVYGRALEDGATGELVQVWRGNVFKTNLSAGNYGIGSDGTLSSSATTKIGYVMSNGVFVRN